MTTDRINHKVKTTFNAERTSDNIRRYREEKGWSQEELAKRADTYKGIIMHYENCGSELSLHLIGKIATALGVCADWLLVWDEEIVE